MGLQELPELRDLRLQGPLPLQVRLQRGGEARQLLLGAPELRQLVLQLGQTARLVVAAGVELLLQAVRGVGEAGALLAGGDEGGDALLQSAALVHREARLADEGAALVHVLRHAQEGLPAVRSGEPLHAVAGPGVDGGELPHGGVGPGGASGDGYLAPGGGRVHHPGHGAAGPGLIAALVRVGGAVLGAQAVEHHPEEGRPGGLAPLVGGVDDVQARLQVQRGVFQPPEGGGKSFDLHRIVPYLCE